MPARPEDRRASRFKWTSEILGNGEAERLGCTDGDVRIAREIEEELQAIAEREAPNVGAAPVGNAIESGIDAVAGQNSLSQQFCQLHHQHAGRNALEAACDVVPTRNDFGTELRKHLRHPANRAGDHYRKENHVERKFEEGRIDVVALVDVKQVAHCLESPERDA